MTLFLSIEPTKVFVIGWSQISRQPIKALELWGSTALMPGGGYRQAVMIFTESAFFLTAATLSWKLLQLFSLSPDSLRPRCIRLQQLPIQSLPVVWLACYASSTSKCRMTATSTHSFVAKWIISMLNQIIVHGEKSFNKDDVLNTINLGKFQQVYSN